MLSLAEIIGISILHINELTWKIVRVCGDLYESPYLAKATPFMDS